jgi:hypothetical protein
VMADETSDILNRKTLNILVKPLGVDGPFRLITTKFLERCDAAHVSQSVIECLQKLGVPLSDLLTFHSDNARYMNACASTLKGLSPRYVYFAADK